MKRNMFSALLLVSFIGFFLLFALLGNNQAAAEVMAVTVVYVDADSTAVGPDGSSWGMAYPTLQDAVAAAGTPTGGDIVEIWVAEGIYYPDEGGAATPDINSAVFEIGSNIQLYGGFKGTESDRNSREGDPTLTVLSGDLTQDDVTDLNGTTLHYSDQFGTNSATVVELSSCNELTYLDGFVITGGQGGSAGGIVIQNCAPVLQGITVIGNNGVNGGGIYLQQTTLTTGTVQLDEVSFLNNFSLTGGGGMFVDNIHLEANDLLIEGNVAQGSGGGIYHNQTGELRLDGVQIRDNQAGGQGGALYSRNGEKIISNYMFEKNRNTHISSFGGGAIFNYAGNLTLTTGYLRGNQSGRHGGGLYMRGGYFHIRNSVISGNYAANSSGGMILSSLSSGTLTNVSISGNKAEITGGILSNAPSLLIQNSLIWNNRDNAGAGDLAANGQFISNPTIRYSNIEGSGGSSGWLLPAIADGGDNIDADPLFIWEIDPDLAPSADGEYRPSAVTSPIVNTGDSNADLDGTFPLTETVSVISADVDGSARVVSSTIDIGAFEFDQIVDVAIPTDTVMLEGESITITFKLFSEPPVGRGNNVTIPLSLDSDKCALSDESITLYSANWDSGVPVVVSGIDNFVQNDSETCRLITGRTASQTAALNNYDPIDFLLTVEDNDVPAIDGPAIVTSTISETESISYTYRLETVPANSVNIIFASSDPLCTFAANSLTFTPSNWSTAQAVSVDAGHDFEVLGAKTCEITTSVTSLDADYHGLSLDDLSVTVNDIDVAGVTVSPAAITLTEGTTATLQISISSKPSAVSVYEFASNNSACRIVGDSFATFRGDNWESDIEIVIEGTEDNVVTPIDASCTISVTAHGPDLVYGALAPDPVEVTVIDNDVPGIGVPASPILLDESEHTQVSYTSHTVSTAPITITFESSDESECVVRPPSISFTAVSGQVQITAAVDHTIDGDSTCTITQTVTSDDPVYDGLEIGTLEIQVGDIDVAALEIDTITADPEQSNRYTVPIRIASIPADDVSFNFSSADGCEITPTSLTYNSSNWNRFLNLTVVNPLDDEVCTIDIVVVSEDSYYGSLEIDSLEISAGSTGYSVYLPIVVR